MEIGYKVISGKRIGRPASNVALQRVRYPLNGTWIDRPLKAGPFAVFDNLKSAVIFLKSFGSQLWKCEYIRSNEMYLWKKTSPFYIYYNGGQKIYRKQKDKAGMIATYPLMWCPSGTVLADKVRFVKRIK